MKLNQNNFDVKFHNELVDMIENLLKVFHQDRKLCRVIKQYYLDYKASDRSNYIHSTVELLSPLIDQLRRQDEGIFLQEGPLNLLPNFDFKLIWGHEQMDGEIKELVWKYLSNLYIVGCHYIQKNDQQLKEILQSMRLNQILEKIVQQEEQTEQEKNEQAEQLGKELKRLFENLFTPDSFVYEIMNLEEIQDIIRTLKSNPIGTLRRFVGDGGHTFRTLAENIVEKIKSKVISGELDRRKFEGDVQKIRRIVDKLKRDLPNDPRIKQFMEMFGKKFNFDLSDIFNSEDGNLEGLSEKIKKATGINLDAHNMEDLMEDSGAKLEEIIQTAQNQSKVDGESKPEGGLDLSNFVQAINEIVCNVNNETEELNTNLPSDSDD